MFTIEKFMNLCIEPDMLTVEIYSCDKGEIVWSGSYDKIPNKYAETEVLSWDCPTEPYKMTFNI